MTFPIIPSHTLSSTLQKISTETLLLLIPFSHLPDGSVAVSSPAKAELCSQSFASNSTLDNSGSIPYLHPPLTRLCLPLESLPRKYLVSSLVLTFVRCMLLMVLLLF